MDNKLQNEGGTEITFSSPKELREGRNVQGEIERHMQIAGLREKVRSVVARLLELTGYNKPVREGVLQAPGEENNGKTGQKAVEEPTSGK